MVKSDLMVLLLSLKQLRMVLYTVGLFLVEMYIKEARQVGRDVPGFIEVLKRWGTSSPNTIYHIIRSNALSK